MKKSKTMKYFGKIFAVAAITSLCAGTLSGCSGTALGLFSGSKTKSRKNFAVDYMRAGKNGPKYVEVTNDDDFLNKKNYINSVLEAYFLYDVDQQAMYEGMFRGMLDALDDPYTFYYTPDEYAQMTEDTSGLYCGIGTLVNQNMETGAITIVRPFADSPAAKAGVLAGDILVEIDGENVSEWSLDFAVTKMRGEPDTPVTIKVYRPLEGEYHEMKIIRAIVESESVSFKMMDDKIGYINVSEFNEPTYDQFLNAYKSLTKQGMKGLVIDLRNNPGGLVYIVSDMLDEFLDSGMIVYMEEKSGNRSELKAEKGKQKLVPTTVLMNENSASASEIFAGCMQDYGLATIVGTQSFGKGIVQNVIPMADGSAFQLTIAHYFTPNGRCIHGIGITPDVEAKLDPELARMITIPEESDTQLQEAIRVVKEKMN